MLYKYKVKKLCRFYEPASFIITSYMCCSRQWSQTKVTLLFLTNRAQSYIPKSIKNSQIKLNIYLINYFFQQNIYMYLSIL